MTDIDPDRRYTLDEFNTIPDWEKLLDTEDKIRARWPTLNLADPQYAIPPDPPAIAGLLYQGKRHVASGPQESAKTLIC
jgi:hypothetical protein